MNQDFFNQMGANREADEKARAMEKEKEKEKEKADAKKEDAKKTDN